MTSPRLSTLLRRLVLAVMLSAIGALALTGLTARPAAATLGSISGNVFDDLNNDGAIDNAETNHASVVVYIDSNGNGMFDAGEPTTLADGTGAYSFNGIADGSYRVMVTPPTGYGATNAPVIAAVTGGANVANADVGISNVGAISGTVFNDVNGNGTQDTGDAALSGKTVYIDANNSGTYNPGEVETPTDAYGNYTFTNLTPGTTATVRVLLAVGATLTSPLPSATTISAATISGNVNFASFTQATVSGTVYNDLNGNGTKDSGDSGLTGKIVFLDSNGNGVKDTSELSATTTSTGAYTITGVGPGTFPVRLAVPATAWQSTANPANVVATSGSSVSGDDFGQFTYGSISGFVYNDTNASGAKDTSETGLTGKTVYVDANSNGTYDNGELTTTTSGTGAYTFSNLGPGSYAVRAVVPSGQTQTSTNPAVITMTSNSISTSINIGFFADATLSGQIYDDTNGNGTLTAGENGVASVVVFLDANSNGALDGGEVSTSTDSTGHYSFTGLGPGTYKVRVVVPTGSMQTSTPPSANTPTSGSTTTITMGLFRLATISGTAFNDVSGNGAKDTGDNGLSGLTVFLDTNSNSSFDLGEPNVVTDSLGNWSITGLTPGSYRPRIVIPSGSTLTTTLPTAITTTSGLVSTTSNFGLFSSASIAGSVYGDFDGDGSREMGEAGLAGKTVYLDANNDGALSTGEVTTSTDSSGNYIFTGLGPGIYRPRLSLPSGTVLTSTNVPTVTTSSSSATTGIDFADFTTATISGTIFNDVNGNGNRDGGDAGLATRTVYVDVNNNGVKDTSEPSIITATGGSYTFTGLGPGTFQVRVITPTGSLQTSANPSPDTTTSGSAAGGNDFGLYTYASIAGTVYNDLNGSGTKTGTEPGAVGKTVFLDTNNNGILDTGEVSTTTTSTGTYSFTGLIAGSYNVRLLAVTAVQQTTANPAASIVGSAAAITGIDFGIFNLASVSGQVYNDSNGNGTKNMPDDVGVVGATVFLDTNSNGILDTGEPFTTTDAGGSYGFANLGAGTFKPRVVVPASATLTTATLPVVTTTSGATSTGNDLGLFTNGIISGTIFVDTNGNGVLDGSETGVANIRVYSDTNGNNLYTAGEPTALTDSNGNYSMTGLKVGAYKPRVVLPTNDVASTPTPATVNVVSSTVASGVSFGLFVPGSITGLVYTDTNGNGVRDASDNGLSGKIVYVDANNNGVKDTGETSATTSTTGTYTLTNLNAGSYAVRLVLPTGQVQTTTDPTTITMTSGLASTGVDFGIRTPPTSTTTTPTSPTTPVVVPPPPAPVDAVSAGNGYWMTSASGDVFAYGNAAFFGEATPFRPTAPVVGLAPTISNLGYYQVSSDGGIFAFGDAKFYGSMGDRVLNKPMVGMAVTPTGAGYWTVASDGGVFSYGDAKFYGSTGAITLNKPIVSIVPTSTGKGYWLVASDGGIFAYGDAKFFGSTGSIKLNQPIVGMARAAGDAGYWMVASDGGIFAFGNAPFYGSMGSHTLNKPIVSIHAPYTGDGYWMFASDGGVFAYGSAGYFGSTPDTPTPVVE